MEIKTLFTFFFAKVLLVLSRRHEEESKFYELTAQDLKTKEDMPMSRYKGKVILIVNVASECGYTENHYRELIDLQRSYGKDKFEILGFPCNQFGKQEPKNNDHILTFVTTEYQVNFQMFGKIKTNGQYKHPVYRWLYKATGKEPDWNFNKFLVDQKGKIVRYAPSAISPFQMEDDIKTLLAGKKLSGDVTAFIKQKHEEL